LLITEVGMNVTLNILIVSFKSKEASDYEWGAESPPLIMPSQYWVIGGKWTAVICTSDKARGLKDANSSKQLVKHEPPNLPLGFSEGIW